MVEHPHHLNKSTYIHRALDFPSMILLIYKMFELSQVSMKS